VNSSPDLVIFHADNAQESEPEPDPRASSAECEQLPHICARLDAIEAGQRRLTADVVAAIKKRGPLALVAVALAGSVSDWLPALIEGFVRAFAQ